MTLGGIAGIATGFAIYGPRAIVFSVFLALFAAVGVDPLVRWFQRQRMSRTWAIITVILIIAAVFVALVWGLLPLVIRQIQLLATAIPAEISQLRGQGWFEQANETSNGTLGELFKRTATEIKIPVVWASLGSGVAGFGSLRGQRTGKWIFHCHTHHLLCGHL